MRIPAAGEGQKFVACEAMDYGSGQIIFQCCAPKGEDAFRDFLNHLAHELPADEPPVRVVY